MNVLQQALLMVRAGRRRVASRLGRPSPRLLQPARLVIRLDGTGIGDHTGDGEPLSVAQWQARLVEAVRWLSALPVTILVGPRGDHPQLVELVRFANRLDCPTLLDCWGGIDGPRALALIDAGLRGARIQIGGVTEPVHRSVVGGALDDARATLRALHQARTAREASLDLEILVPWRGRIHEEVEAVFKWTRRSGADGVRLTAPWFAAELPADPELLDEVGGADVPFNRTHPAALRELHAMVAAQDGAPGMSRRRSGRRCPVGGQRLELGARGKVACCPFKTPMQNGEMQNGEGLPEIWSRGRAHLEEIATCQRACAHIELSPEPIVLADLSLRF
ncbi:MAG: hypothetical protein AAFV53_09430 [Myxococcota bacterium]